MEAGGVVEIQLTQGRVALVDEMDYAWASQWKWYALDNKRGHIYAARRGPNGSPIYLHREVAKAPKGSPTDHIDGDTLRCTRANLRVCTRGENARNRKRHAHSTSPYKGVAARGGRWAANIFVGGKRLYFCGFKTAEEAARAYDRAAIEHFGAFARLNFPEAA